MENNPNNMGNEAKYCLHCGQPIGGDSTFCQNCGQPLSQSPVENTQQNTNANPTPPANQSTNHVPPQQAYAYPPTAPNANPKKKSKLVPILIAAGSVVVLSVAAILVFVFMNMGPSVDELLIKGDYEQAYKVANDEQKEQVKIENLIAYLSAKTAEDLKDSSSFELKAAWYDNKANRIVLEVAAKNSYGAVVRNFWYYTSEEDEKEYNLYTTLSDLDQEKSYSFDEPAEKLEKTLKNLARLKVKEIIGTDDFKVEKVSIKNINNLFKEELLEDVKLIKEEK